MMKIAGITVKGPSHKAEKKPNQDAIKIKKYKKAYVIAVADGFGSSLKSDLGSKIAVMSVHESYKIWSKSKVLKTEHLLRLIHLLWEQGILPESASDCYTTCLFAIALKDKLILGQLGDGLCLYLNKSNQTVVRLESNKIYSNQTIGLGVATKISQWKIQEINPNKHFAIMLCTDGIADDLEAGKEADFLEHLVSEIKDFNKKKKKAYLKKELNNWPVPKHSDDKTIGLLWRQG